jgi:integrase
MRAFDIDMSGLVWEYRPQRYKTQHHNGDGSPDRDRVVYLGPRAQAILKPYLTLKVGDYLFSPAHSEAERNARRGAERKTKLWPSHERARQNKRVRKRKRPPRDHYDVTAYRRAIRRGCIKARVPVWCPLQLRHTAGTAIRKLFGLEASQAVLGHRELGVTQVYAEVDRDKARSVMAQVG